MNFEIFQMEFDKLIDIIDYSTNDDVYYTCNGRIIYDSSIIPHDAILQRHERIRGGKGGFGSMLRAIGNQIEKTTNHGMCRDLTGRRMRDVEMEKKLKEWYDKASEREREKMERYLEKRRKRQEILERGPLPGHIFSDREYERQKRKIEHDHRSAIDDALWFIKENNSNKASSSADSNVKRSRLWLENFDDSSDSSSSYSAKSGCDDDVAKDVCEEIKEEINVEDSSKINKIEPTIKSEPTEDKVPEIVEPVKIIEPVKCDPASEPLTDQQLTDATSITDLEQFGLDVLKVSLSSRGLKCGGTINERASRLFSIRHLTPDQYPAKLLVKAKSAN